MSPKRVGLIGSILIVFSLLGIFIAVGEQSNAAQDIVYTPDPSCVGWWCTLSGTVYAVTASPGNELAGAAVELKQFSVCSPTAGQQQTVTGPDGSFEFEVYLHDTDYFWITGLARDYEPAGYSFSGFDCLFCACPPAEIVLQRGSLALLAQAFLPLLMREP
jgi:hypothetical protein